MLPNMLCEMTVASCSRYIGAPEARQCRIESKTDILLPTPMQHMQRGCAAAHSWSCCSMSKELYSSHESAKHGLLQSGNSATTEPDRFICRPLRQQTLKCLLAYLTEMQGILYLTGL